jgi:Zn-dependent protease with chaperone function
MDRIHRHRRGQIDLAQGVRRLRRWSSSHWALLAALLLLVVYLCVPYIREEGWPALHTHVVDLALNLALHLAAIRIVVPMVMLLLVAAAVVVKNVRHVAALRALRLAPGAKLAAAAGGIVPLGRVYALADARPFAVCVGLWRPAIYVSSGLVEGVSPAGLRAAVAHEEAHRRRGDPARLLALRIVIGAVTPVPWLGTLADRVALRAEIRADRFAREQTSTAALAEALLAAFRGSPFLMPPRPREPLRREPRRHVAATGLAGSEEGASPASPADLDLRLRYLQVPCADPLPAALPPDLTLGGALRSLAHVLPYGLTGRRGNGLVLALACLVPWVEAFGPWADTLMDLLYI